MRVALIAQNDDKTKEVMIEGESGLLECSPPWHRAEVVQGRVLWPNGAQAFPFSPEAPGDIRGPGVHLAWCSEFVAWPIAKRDEAWSNVRLMTRLGYARVVWDTTPKRRHPIIRALLARAAADPRRHRVVRGTTRANSANISQEAIAEWEEEYGGTQRGREELGGEFLDDSDGALWKQSWIDRARREQPPRFERRILAIDPHYSMRKGTDATGIIDAGLGPDGQVYICGDMSGKHPWEVWADKLVVRYVDCHCDCIVVERNRGGDSCTANIRTSVREFGRARGEVWDVVLVDDAALTRWTPGTINIKEVIGRSSKEVRGEPVAAVYEKGRVSHVLSVDLTELEDVLTTWEPVPGAVSPNALDALVWAVWELLGLGREDRRANQSRGIEAVQRRVAATALVFAAADKL